MNHGAKEKKITENINIHVCIMFCTTNLHISSFTNKTTVEY